MKVIGITEVPGPYRGEKAYVVIVTHDELRKVADKAGYSHSNGKDDFPELKVGQDYDIAAGHDFRQQLTDAVKTMASAYEKFAKVAPVAAEFAGMVRSKAERHEGGAA